MQKDRRTYRKTRLFGGISLALLILSAFFCLIFGLNGNGIAAAALLAVSTLFFQGVFCFVLYHAAAVRFCFARAFYRPLPLALYFTALVGAAVGGFFLAKTALVGGLLCLLPAAEIAVTAWYGVFLFGKGRVYTGGSYRYMETVLTVPFFVNGTDIFDDKTREKVAVNYPLLNPVTGGAVGGGDAFVVQGKEFPFGIGLLPVGGGATALYALSTRDYVRLCVLEGFDGEIANDRKRNQEAFDACDFPAFHEEGYYYTKERETRFRIIQEEGAFVVVEEALYWDEFLYRAANSSPPYVWKELYGDAFEYFADAQKFMEKRLKEENEKE